MVVCPKSVHLRPGNGVTSSSGADEARMTSDVNVYLILTDRHERGEERVDGTSLSETGRLLPR